MAPDKPPGLDRVYRLEQCAEWQHLLDHLRLMDGFGLILLLAPEQAGVDVCRQALVAHFAKDERSVHCLQLRHGEPAGGLGQRLLHEAIPPDAAAVWVDAPAPELPSGEYAIRELWRLALAALNPQRNSLRRRLKVPLIIAGSMWLQQIFEHSAADLWSIRDTIARIEPTKQDFQGAAMVGINIGSSTGDPDGEPGDPEKTRMALARLRKRKIAPARRNDQRAIEARLLQRLGNQFRRLFRLDEAEEALLKAAEWIEENPRTLQDEISIISDLAALYRAKGEFDREEFYTRKAYEFANAHFGAESDVTLSGRNNLSGALFRRGNHVEAEQEARAVLEIRQRLQGTDHHDVYRSKWALASIFLMQGKAVEAETVFRQVIPFFERILGVEHEDTLSCRANLATALRLQGKFAEAEREHRSVLEILERSHGTEHPRVLMGYFLQGRSLAALEGV